MMDSRLSPQVVDLVLSDDDEPLAANLTVEQGSANGAIDLTEDVDDDSDSREMCLSAPESGPGLGLSVGRKCVSGELGLSTAMEQPMQPEVHCIVPMVECTSCLEEGKHNQMFRLDACGHEVCPKCVAKHLCHNTSPTTLVCPVPTCTALVSVRDLALVLQEDAWDKLQSQRLEAFRRILQEGVRCSACSGWVEASGESVMEMDVAVMEGGQSRVDNMEQVVEKCQNLLAGPTLSCQACNMIICRMCGEKAQEHTCGATKLLSLGRLLTMLSYLIEARPTQTVPAAVPAKGMDSPRGRGRGGARGRGWGRGRGRGR
ncbi:unnamed protein product, partial [Choristocarpus tenellus]